MKEFNSLSDFGKFLKRVNSNYEKNLISGLNVIGKHLEEKAKHSIGHLQPSAGEFEAWEQLAASTKSEKARKGYVFNGDFNPLLRTGELRDSIGHAVEKNKLLLGSSDEVMVYQELGTVHIPPRSVLGMTMYKESNAIKKSLSNMLLSWITNTPQKKIQP